ncbi:hypothetical protein GGR92_003653 [Spirosoma lacussanchae]|uniref:hypothetical protein n=1 Tax=Spirosoma lacussanchae TaxID=1884249 RepID=UPI0011092E1F|nr:hypothetical protein [Spirosoma lacussanchae]
MTSTQQFWQFFKALADAVPGMKTVTRSGGDKMDRLLGSTRSEDIYPATFLLRPKYSLEENGAGLVTAWFDATYYVLCSAQMGEEADEDSAFDEAERLASTLSVLIRQQEDGYKTLIDPMAKVFMEPIQMVNGEASFGYEVRQRIGLMVNAEVYADL